MKTILTFAGALLFSAGVIAQETELQKQNVPSEVNLETVVTEEQPVLAEISQLSSPIPVDSMMLELIEIEGSQFVEVKLTETTAELSEVDLYEQGESDALKLYEGDKKSGTATLVGTSLMLPMGIISGLDQSSAKKKESFPEIKDPFLKSNAAYMKGFSDQALKMRKKAVKKNFLIGIGIQSVVAFGVGALIMNSSGNPRVGMSGL